MHTPKTVQTVMLILVMLGAIQGCCPFSVTAVSDAQVQQGNCCRKTEGIPFYLPKPLLVISKNFQYIEESTVGLTQPVPIPNQFDKQDTFATLNAQAGISTTSESSTPPAQDGSKLPAQHKSKVAGGDGGAGTPDSCCSTQVLHSSGAPLTPDPSKVTLPVHTPFFTYQIIFVPDLTQKHYLRIKGGPGEVRATLNMVNGWMFTGLGPFYLKDSSTAQNILATGVLAKFGGSGAADVINSVANLGKVLQTGGAGQQKLETMRDALAEVNLFATKEHSYMPTADGCIQAEIHVYEPHLTHEGDMEWREITSPEKCFVGQYLGVNSLTKPRAGVGSPQLTPEAAAKDQEELRKLQNRMVDTQNKIIETANNIDARESATRDKVLPAAVPVALDPSVDKAALQKLSPPQPRKRFLDWICPRPRVSNTQLEGQTSAQ